VGTAVLGQTFDRMGWAATVIGIGLSLAVASALAARLMAPSETPAPDAPPSSR
jgi:hypothetical protein